MSIWQRLMYWIGLRESPGPRYYQLTENLHVTLSTLASRENRTEQELAKDIFAAGLTQYYETFELWDLWDSLTPREQDNARCQSKFRRFPKRGNQDARHRNTAA